MSSFLDALINNSIMHFIQINVIWKINCFLICPFHAISEQYTQFLIHQVLQTEDFANNSISLATGFKRPFCSSWRWYACTETRRR
jgi:hypothetical protein